MAVLARGADYFGRNGFPVTARVVRTEPAGRPWHALVLRLDRPPRCASTRERALLRRMCQRAEVEFTEWEVERLLTEFKRNLSEAQWVTLREDEGIRSNEDALQALIVFGFENRRLARLRLRGRGRDRLWAEPEQRRRMSALLRRPSK